MMKALSVHDFRSWFDVLHTTEHSQVAIMKLDAGKSTGEKPESHPISDQILLVLEGSVQGQVADEQVSVSKGEFIIVPAGIKHRFTNHTDEAALTFNVYCGPAYPPGTQG